MSENMADGFEIEMQIWEYLDERCSAEDRVRIARLIREDELWKKMYAEIAGLQHGLSGHLELEHPGMRFTQNVMEAVAQEKVAPSAKTYLNKWIIRSIAALFTVVIAGVLIAVFKNIRLMGSESSAFADFNVDFPNASFIANGPLVSGFLFLNMIAAMILLDSLLKRRSRTRYM